MSLFSSRIAIDLGTAYSVIAQVDKDELVRTASSIAVDKDTQQPVAFGDEAKRMLGRCPDRYEVILPLKDGVIADFQATHHYLRYLISSATKNAFAFHYDIFLCVPWGATAVELRSYHQALGGPRRKIYLVREPFAAALGMGLDILGESPVTVMDMGGGTTEIATMSGGYMIHASSLRAAGNFCDQLLMDGIRQAYEFEVGQSTAELLKMQHASVWPVFEDYVFEVKGLLRRTQLPDQGQIDSADLRSFLDPYALRVETQLKDHLQRLPSEAQKQIELQGIVLAGGTSLIHGWKERLEHRVGIPIHGSTDPTLAVIRGMKRMIENPSRYKDIFRISERVFAG